MSSSTPPIIAFELGVGEFRIVTPEAVYQIKVCRDLVAQAKEPQGEERAQVSGQEADLDRAQYFFQDISEELFGKIGHLARKLSVSVEELPSMVNTTNLGETDQQLENAKGHLQEVVKITEKASMTIMDMADSIQGDMDELRHQLDILQNLELVAPTGSATGSQVETEQRPPSSPESFSGPNPALLAQLDEIKKFISHFQASAGQGQPEAPQAAGSPEELPQLPSAEPQKSSQTINITRFDVDVVFQTLYELCTNESVKAHIKAMREAQHTAFNSPAVADHLSELAPTVSEEDGFFNFPIVDILKTLYGATNSEDFRLTLKKMNQTAASIFLDSVLPIEGEITEVEVPLEPDLDSVPPPPSEPSASPSPTASEKVDGCSQADLEALGQLIDEAHRLASSATAQAQVASSPSVDSQLYTPILTQDRDTIITTVNQARDLIQKTGDHLTHILEALSFQDLSGQRIMKVVSLISDVQVQLLSILVSVNAKLKVHKEKGSIEAKSATAEQLAQEEVDKAFEKLTTTGPSDLAGPVGEARLDQSAVNDLLAQLGF